MCNIIVARFVTCKRNAKVLTRVPSNFYFPGFSVNCSLTKSSTLKRLPRPSQIFCFGEKILPSSESAEVYPIYGVFAERNEHQFQSSRRSVSCHTEELNADASV